MISKNSTIFRKLIFLNACVLAGYASNNIQVSISYIHLVWISAPFLYLFTLIYNCFLLYYGYLLLYYQYTYFLSATPISVWISNCLYKLYFLTNTLKYFSDSFLIPHLFVYITDLLAFPKDDRKLFVFIVSPLHVINQTTSKRESISSIRHERMPHMWFITSYIL